MNGLQLIKWKIKSKNLTLREKAFKFLIVFLIFMLLFTILSRGAVNLITPIVTLSAPEKGTLSYEKTAAGTVEEDQIEVVHVLAGIRIKRVSVKDGDVVQEGDILLELDMEDLNEKISKKNQEIEILNLGIGDIQSQKLQQQQEKQQDRQRAEEDYQKTQQNTQNSVQRAQQDRTDAESRLAQWTSLPEDSMEEEKSSYNEQRLILEDACKQAQRAYEESLRAQEEALTAAKRLIEDALKPEALDRTSETMQMEKQVLEVELNKMQDLAEQDGEIMSPISGTVQKLTAEAGGVTMDTMAVAITDASAGGRFVAQIPKEQQNFFGKGDTVTLASSNGNTQAEGLTIASVKENQEDDQMLDVTVLVPGGQKEIGKTPVMSLKKTSKAYPITVPIEALRTDEKGYFVLVIQEEQGILGSELFAGKVNVTVLEKNGQTAALEEGMLSNDQQIIISSEKPIEAGSRVRLDEE